MAGYGQQSRTNPTVYPAPWGYGGWTLRREDRPMDTIAYHQKLAVLAHERGDYWSAARHYRDAANCYPSPEQAESCLKSAERELAHEESQHYRDATTR
jgi:hypothetical protein